MENQLSLNEFKSAANACAQEMLANASYIEEQLPTIDVSSEHRAAIIDVCSGLVGTKHDVVSELHELEESVEPAIVPARVERIIKWLAEDLPKLDALVMTLDAASRVPSDKAVP